MALRFQWPSAPKIIRTFFQELLILSIIFLLSLVSLGLLFLPLCIFYPRTTQGSKEENNKANPASLSFKLRLKALFFSISDASMDSGALRLYGLALIFQYLFLSMHLFARLPIPNVYLPFFFVPGLLSFFPFLAFLFYLPTLLLIPCQTRKTVACTLSLLISRLALTTLLLLLFFLFWILSLISPFITLFFLPLISRIAYFIQQKEISHA